MQGYFAKIHLRYLLAIVVTAGLMVWQSTDAVRTGAELYGQALFWSASVTAGWLQMIVISRGVRATIGVERYPGWVLLAASALIGALPLTFQVRWMMQTIVAPELGLPAPWVTYLNVTLICTVFSLIQYLLIERWPIFEASLEQNPRPVAKTATCSENEFGAESDEATRGSDSRPPNIGLLSRRPDGLTGTIQYMQMEDHYLRVHTEGGMGLILHRMSDAVSELSGTDGLQVHKSWWVSRTEVLEVRRHNRARSILTRDGTVIPISRSFEKSVREAGWF